MKYGNNIMNVAIVLIAFLSGLFIQRMYLQDPDHLRHFIVEGEVSSNVLLDSLIIDKQLELFGEDSLASIYVLDGMLRVQMTNYYMIEILKRRKILDEPSYQRAKGNAFLYCCL